MSIFGKQGDPKHQVKRLVLSPRQPPTALPMIGFVSEDIWVSLWVCEVLWDKSEIMSLHRLQWGIMFSFWKERISTQCRKGKGPSFWERR